MGLIKRTYTDGSTVITAQNLNDIQDAVISNEGGIAQLQSGKQNVLTFDNAPTAESNNPVKSQGIKSTIDAAVVAMTNASAPVIVNTATGAVASFPDGAALPVRGLTVAITPVQSGSGDPAPDNVRPITGWTQAKIMRAGKNLLPNGWTSQTKNGVVWTVNADGTMTAAQTATNHSQANITDGQVPYQSLGLVRGQTYFLSGCPSGGSSTTYDLQANFYDSTGTTLPSTRGKARDTGNGVSFTLDSDCAYVWVYAIVCSGTTAPSGTWKPMLEPGSTGTAYEPYNGETVTIDLGGTIYGGTLDVTTGVLTVDRAMVDLGTLSWSYQTNYGFFNATITDKVALKSISAPQSVLCAKYNYVGCFNSNTLVRDDAPDKSLSDYASTSGSARIQIKDSNYTDAPTFKAAMSGVQLVYELAEPQTVQLTPAQVETLVGANAVWADTGDSTVDYCADTKLYIDAQIAALVATMSET